MNQQFRQEIGGDRSAKESPVSERGFQTETTGQKIPSFTARWRGELQPAHRDDARYDTLARKYLTPKET